MSENKNSKQVKATKKFNEDMVDVMRTQQGRDVLNFFITQGGYGMPPFRGATNETIHNLGMMSLATQIFNACQAASPDLNLKMISERLNVR